MPTVGLSIVSSVILALCIQQPLPVPGLIGLLGIGVYKHLDVARPKEATLADFKDQEVLLLNDQSGQGADHGRGDAPVKQLTSSHLERGAVQGANNDIANHISALAHGCADVGAQVAHAEEGASLCLADQHIVARQRQGFQLLRLKLRGLHASLDPGQGRQDGLRGVPRGGLGALTTGCQADSSRRARGHGRHLHAKAAGRLLSSQGGPLKGSDLTDAQKF